MVDDLSYERYLTVRRAAKRDPTHDMAKRYWDGASETFKSKSILRLEAEVRTAQAAIAAAWREDKPEGVEVAW